MNTDVVDPDPGIAGAFAKWRDVAMKKTGQEFAPSTGKGKQATPAAGAMASTKTLRHVYANKQTAARAAKLDWQKIRERREIIKGNSSMKNFN